MDADLAPEKTEGFKVGEKKTIDEYTKLGAFLISATDQNQLLRLTLLLCTLSNHYCLSNLIVLQTKKTRLSTDGRPVSGLAQATPFLIQTIPANASFRPWPWYVLSLSKEYPITDPSARK